MAEAVKELRVEDTAEKVRVLTLSNPRKRNALDEELLRALRKTISSAPAAGIRALLVRAEGKNAFCAGYDLTQLATGTRAAKSLPDDFLMETLRELETSSIPSVACLTGAAYGAGCDLAAACDFRVGSDAAMFCLPPARLGVIYADEGISRMARLIGVGRAKRMFLTGMEVRGVTASEWGLLDDRPMTFKGTNTVAMELAEHLAQMAPLAVAGMKRTFRELSAGPLTQEGKDALRELRRAAYASEDAKEGKAAFTERRPPIFHGR